MAKAKELIKAATISRVSDKAGKFLGFGVKSNRSNDYYQIHCTKTESGVTYTCNCEAKTWGHAVCSHIKAVVELVEARKMLQLDAAAVVAPLVLGSADASDLPAHLDDAFSAQEPEMGDIAAEIIAAEQAEKARKLAAQEAYRQAWPEDFSYYAAPA